MNRRQFLAVGSTTASLLSGCLGSRPSCTDESDWPPSVDVEALELVPGGSGEFEIQVDGITSFQFDWGLYPCGRNIPVRFEDIDISPSIDSQADPCPPIWIWENCTRVTVSVTVHAAPDAEPGTYDYGFQIAEDIGERHSQDYEYAITVAENDSAGTLSSR